MYCSFVIWFNYYLADFCFSFCFVALIFFMRRRKPLSIHSSFCARPCIAQLQLQACSLSLPLCYVLASATDDVTVKGWRRYGDVTQRRWSVILILIIDGTRSNDTRTGSSTMRWYREDFFCRICNKRRHITYTRPS